MSPSLFKRASGFTRFHGGVSPRHAKGTKNLPIVPMPLPSVLTIPLKQHTGAVCEPLVKVGDLVRKGQMIADAPAHVCAPLHAPTSGKVKSIAEVVTETKTRVMAITLIPDGEDLWVEDLQAPVVTDKASFLNAVRQSGLVGLGGAGFPTHAKMRAPEGKTFDTLVVNAAECEPYLTVDFRIMLEQTENILHGISETMKYLDLPQAVIGVEDNKKEAIDQLRRAIASQGALAEKVKVVALPARYPQGAEKTLIYATTGREVPMGGLPFDVSCLVLNVTTLAVLGNYLKTGQPLLSKNVTVAGDAVAEEKNLSVLIGTPIAEIIDFCGGFQKAPAKLLMGGPMMGLALYQAELPLLKYNNGILAFSEEALQTRPETDCIRCGRCGRACPMQLLPRGIMMAIKREKHQDLKSLHVNNCIGCGCCAYECPAQIPLVHYMKLGKEIVLKKER